MSGILHRDTIRLRGFDYSKPALYFITICAHKNKCLFGSIRESVMTLSDLGIAATDCWLEIPKHFPNTILHEYVIMPNHIHGIIQIVDDSVAKIKSVNSGINNTTNNTTNNMANNVAHNVGAKNFSPLHYGHYGHCGHYGKPTPTRDDAPAPAHDGDITPIHYTAPMTPHNDTIPTQISHEFSPLEFQHIDDNTPTTPFRSPSRTIGSVVRGFKIGVTKIARTKNKNITVWQRNYHEHIIRNEKSYNMISEYIRNNPASWMDDRFHV